MTVIHFVENASMDKELRLETQQQELNRLGFVRAPKAKAQWILLVNEAITGVNLLPQNYLPLRDYLATMMARFIKDAQFLRFMSSYGMWQRALSVGGLSSAMAQQIADVGLLYVTLFRGYATYRHNARSISFATDLTERLYYRLSEESKDKDDCESISLRSMHEHFGLSIMALRALTDRSHLMVKDDPFQDAVRFPTNAEIKSDAMGIDEFFSLVDGDSTVSSSH